MPLTRRVQVFISQAASEKFDLLLAAHKLGPTALIEALIFRANPLETLNDPFVRLDTKPDSQPINGAAHDRTIERIDDLKEIAENTHELNKSLPEDWNSLSPESKQARAEKKQARAARKAALQNDIRTSLDAIGPTVESGRGKATTEVFTRKPLERKQVVSIPKPGRKKN